MEIFVTIEIMNFRNPLCAFFFIWFFFLSIQPMEGCAAEQLPDQSVVDHELTVEFDLEKQTLSVSDRITLPAGEAIWPQRFRLARHAVVLEVRGDQRPVPFTFRGGTLALPASPGKFQTLLIRYEAKFDDAVPMQTVGIEDPSYGINATITSNGTYLSGGVNWIPWAIGHQGRLNVTLRGPKGFIGVTDGALISIEHAEASTSSIWQTNLLNQTPTLSAGYFLVARNDLETIQVLTFLSPANAALADQYLAASREYLSLYQELFGPYPYEKFAVVENFFPTGYGLPGWTLLGSTVVRLPFILYTSLPHEIAHAWWGNAVGVDYYRGNWCEGLATYVADYLLKERTSPEDAHEYRLKLLRDYASLVQPNNDYPLSEFRSRKSKLDQAIGYGKTAMVFHMLRQKVGDEHFWDSLRRMALEARGKRLGWTDLKRFFAETSGQNLDVFFAQWIEESGAPQLTIQDVKLNETTQEWHVSGTVAQRSDQYQLNVPLAITTPTETYRYVVPIAQRESRFAFRLPDRPLKLEVDPDNHIFRHLYPSETPPTINALRAAEHQLVVKAADLSEEMLRESNDLLLGLHWDSAASIDESQLTDELISSHDLLYIGWPQHPAVLRLIPEHISVNQTNFRLQDNAFDNSNDALFLVLQTRDADSGIVGIFLPMSPQAAKLTARRISHYGRYSYLAFAAGSNQVKGTWPTTESPLIVHFTEGTQ
ncbi:MAG: M1 family peptidase [Deltaproteobacteria bacterium]|jgi:hypothetical protein|nr:M1 family peptidase [Deltaproteobacteria bacterium]